VPIARWGCLAFLIGIACHSFFLSPGRVFVSSVFLVFAVLLMGLRHTRAFAILCLFFLAGWMRFELAVPSLPHGLHPLDPHALATQQASPNDPFASQRNALSAKIKTLFPGDQGALLAGMLYGERGLSASSKQAFRQAGLTHLIAVSGSNVSIVVSAVSSLLALFGWTRRRTFMCLSLVMLAFVLFVTPQAPVVRAAIMGWLVAFAPIVGRLPKASHLLLVSAVGFTLWQPTSLLFDPSFALSFLATLGLMTFGSYFSNKLEGRLNETLREAICSTLGATLLTTPYAMWAFGQASAIGLLANVFAVPLVPWIMGVGALALVISWKPIVLAAKGFLAATLWIADLSTCLPGYWSALHVSSLFLITSYVSLGLIWFFAVKKGVYPQKNVRRTQHVK
jgi:ComEC/Rec2-related protein